MDNAHQQKFPIFFPAYFVFMWLAITTFLAALSGWFILMRRYPNRNEKALLQLKNQSGSMGIGVSMQAILRIAVCPSGLRIGITRIAGIFCRDFFVPWQEIKVTRKDGWFSKRAVLQFGNPPVGRLSIFSDTADRLARAALGNWPEPGTFAGGTNAEVFASIARRWAIATFLAAAFFIVAPRILDPAANFPSISLAILFPGVFFGFWSLLEYFSRTKN